MSLGKRDAQAHHDAFLLVQTVGVSDRACSSVSTATARAAFCDAASGSLVGALGGRRGGVESLTPADKQGRVEGDTHTRFLRTERFSNLP